jgi:tetratricopeptide (TPR) repeat protein
MKRAAPDCDGFQRALERRLADEAPIGPAGSSAVGEHATDCAECRALEALVETLAEIPPLESAALERKVLASFEAGRRRRGRMRVVLLSAAGTLAAAAALLLALLPGDPAPAAVGAAEPGGGTAPATEGPALLERGRGLSVGLEAGARATLAGLDGRPSRCTVERGRVAFLVGPGADTPVEVRAGSAWILLAAPGTDAPGEPTGATIAMIEVAGAEVSVDVVSGSAVFVLDGVDEAGRKTTVAAGYGAGTARKGLLPLEEHRLVAVSDLLGLPPPTVNLGGLDQAGPAEPAGDSSRETATLEPDRPAKRAAHDERMPESAIAPRQEAATPGAGSPGELIARAREQRAAGNWNAAADLYRQVLDGYPGRPEANAVLVPLAELELEHLRRPDLALRHFGLYMGRHPDGPLAEEALYGKCLALRALGRANEEAATLAEFLRRYPASVRAQGVKSRLDILGEKIE